MMLRVSDPQHVSGVSPYPSKKGDGGVTSMALQKPKMASPRGAFAGFKEEGHVLIHPSPKKNRWDSKLTLKWAGVGRWNDTLSGVTASTSSEDAGKIQVKLDDELVARNAVQ